MARVLVVIVVLAAFALPARAGVAARARECKAQCAGAIAECVSGGGRPRKCRRTILRDCKRNGISACVPPETFHVATSGIDGPGCGLPAAPCRTIQFVVDDRVVLGGAGTVKVAAGTYDDVRVCPTGATTNQAVVCILNKQITLAGGYAADAWGTPSGDPNTTVLDGGGVGRGLRIQTTGPHEPAASLVLDGFTIRNGLATGASSGDSDRTYGFGGGMFAEHSGVTLRNVVFRDNRVVGGTLDQPEGGRAAGGGLAMNNDVWSADRALASLSNVTFDGNESRGGGGVEQGGDAHGGGMFTYWVNMTGDQVAFTGNRALAGGSSGEGYVGYEKSDALGGAMSVEANSTVVLRHVRATGNEARGGDAPDGEAGGAYGGAFMVELAGLDLMDAVVSGNLARGGDGANFGTSASLAEGGGIHAVASRLAVDRVVVVANEARAGAGDDHGGAAGGGGISLTFDSPFSIESSVIADNLVSIGAGTLIGGGGGGVWVQGSVGTIDHATIANNRLGDGRLLGGALTTVDVPGSSTHVTLTNVIVANHTTASFDPSSWGTAALWAAAGTTVEVTRALFANNVHDTNASVSGGFNLPPGGFTLSDVDHASDAGFVSAGTPENDYHLLATSPAVDRAPGSVAAVDVDGDTRPHGLAPDLGADELVDVAP